MAVVAGRHSVFDFLRRHQFAPDGEEGYEDDQHRNMRRIVASRQAIITHGAQDIMREFRLSQARARSSFRFEKGENVQIFEREAPHHRKSFRRLI